MIGEEEYEERRNLGEEIGSYHMWIEKTFAEIFGVV
jgi:hypothetical protein